MSQTPTSPKAPSPSPSSPNTLTDNIITRTFGHMFGFFFTQPIYISLRHMHAVHIVALYITYLWMDDLINKIPALSPHADAIMVGVYFTNFMALVSIWWTSIKDIRSYHPNPQTTPQTQAPSTSCPKCGK